MDNNTQRSCNTIVQPSSFNGGTSAQSFNFQSMRVVSGYFYIIPPGYTNSTSKQNANQSVVLNDLTNAPIILPVGVCIVAIVIGTKSQQSLTSRVNQYIQSYIGYSKPAFYNSKTNTWEPPDGTGPNLPIINFNLDEVQAGFSSACVSNTIPAYNNLVAFMGAFYTTIEPADTIVSVKLLLLNPTLAQ